MIDDDDDDDDVDVFLKLALTANWFIRSSVTPHGRQLLCLST